MQGKNFSVNTFHLSDEKSDSLMSNTSLCLPCLPKLRSPRAFRKCFLFLWNEGKSTKNYLSKAVS